MTEKTTMPPFSHYLLAAIIILIVFVVVGITTIDYVTAENTHKAHARMLQIQTETTIVDSIQVIDTGLKLFDDTLNHQMQADFTTFMQTYEDAGRDPSKMDLTALKSKLGGSMELYIINESGVVEYTTYQPDLGLDFRASIPYFYDYLMTIKDSQGFFPDRVVQEKATGNLRKFGYMPTPDHRYILELGLAENEFIDKRNRLRYSETIQEIAAENPYIDSVRIFTTAKRLVGNRSYIPDPDLDETLDTILRDRSSIIVQDTGSNRMLRYLFIDLSDPDYSADMSLIVELTYNNARIGQALADLVVTHVAIAVIVLFAASLAALIISRRLTTPIQAIVADVDIIARGDLDHRVSSTMGWEFAILERSIDSMVQQLKRTIEQMRSSEQRYRAVVEDQTELITRFAPDGTHLFANEAYCRYYGKTCGEVQGRRAVSGIPEEDRERVRAFLATLTPDHPVGVIEHQFIMENGETRWHQWSDRAIFDAAGRVTEYLSVGRDITERKKAEEDLKNLYEELERRVDARTTELAAANRELESFTYSVSHDLRAPLRAIDGYSRILLDEYAPILSPDARLCLEKVRANTQAMSRLIDDLLNFSRTGRQPLAKIRVNPADLVKNALDGLRYEQEGRSIDIVVGDLPSCQADPVMLRQVFHNLLSNALKFTRKREKARIVVGSFEKDGHTVYYISDNGIGFDLAYARKIFGVFQRFHPQQEYEGTGVGLAIVKRIIDRHGGECWVESAVEKGTTFFFTLEGSTFNAGR